MNTNAALHPLAGLKARVVEIVQEYDLEGLSRLLRGIGLPALGGNEPPADLIWRSLSYPPNEPGLSRVLARMTAALLLQFEQQMMTIQLKTSEVAEPSSVLSISADVSSTPSRIPNHAKESYLSSLLLFASFLPTEPELAAALIRVFEPSNQGVHLPIEDPTERIHLRLRAALTVQQTDSSLAPYWLLLLEQPPAAEGTLNPADQTRLMDGWTGLLWVPPTPEERAVGTQVPIERIVKGLEALDDAVSDFPESLFILRWALRTLDHAFPRAPEFWIERFQPLIQEEWAERGLLNNLLVERWPVLDVEEPPSLIQ